MNTRKELDWKVPCPDHDCGAGVGEACYIAGGKTEGTVHFGRRLKAIMLEKGITEKSLEARIRLRNKGKFPGVDE